MRSLSDVIWVAVSALRARPLRALLMAVGPLLGVAVIVGAIGVLQSAEGELRLALRDLGRNLAFVSAFDDRLPLEAIERVNAIDSVQEVGGAAIVPAAIATTAQIPGGVSPRVSPVVFTIDPELLDVLDVELAWGRPINNHDDTHAITAAVLGAHVAEAMPLDPASIQGLYINDFEFGIVGVLEPTLLAAELNQAVLIPRSTAETLFDLEPGHSHLYLRIDEHAVSETARLLPIAITYGEQGVPLGVSIPTELLEAQTAIDRTLAGSVVGLGLLAMVVGGFGIANVMMISVLERRREIGVRRALGHSRAAIASQFLTEGVLIGLVGGALGAATGIGFVNLVAQNRGWVAFVDSPLVIGAMAAALVVTLIAALYPTIRAVRLQPLDALRAD
jgi:putative ABC transport system permease protein